MSDEATKPKAVGMVRGNGGLCFAHGPYFTQGCLHWPRCLTDPQIYKPTPAPVKEGGLTSNDLLEHAVPEFSAEARAAINEGFEQAQSAPVEEVTEDTLLDGYSAPFVNVSPAPSVKEASPESAREWLDKRTALDVFTRPSVIHLLATHASHAFASYKAQQSEKVAEKAAREILAKSDAEAIIIGRKEDGPAWIGTVEIAAIISRCLSEAGGGQ